MWNFHNFNISSGIRPSLYSPLVAKSKTSDWCWFELFMSVMVIRLQTGDWCHPISIIRNKPLRFLPTGNNTPSVCDQQLSYWYIAPTAFSLVNTRAPPYFYMQQMNQGSNSDVRIDWNGEYIQFIGSSWKGKIEVENVQHAKRERKKALHRFSFSRMFCVHFSWFVCFF